VASDGAGSWRLFFGAALRAYPRTGRYRPEPSTSSHQDLVTKIVDSSQNVDPGPAINCRTCSWATAQNENTSEEASNLASRRLQSEGGNSCGERRGMSIASKLTTVELRPGWYHAVSAVGLESRHPRPRSDQASSDGFSWRRKIITSGSSANLASGWRVFQPYFFRGGGGCSSRCPE